MRTLLYGRLFNDFYVKDLSKKVKSGITARQKKGECISANAIFGYRKSEADIHKFAIDEETAPIVKQIFDYALAGYHGVEIANMLNQQQIKTPAWFKNKSDRRNYEIDAMTGWTSAKVMKIIRDQRYAGDMVGNVRVTTKIAKSDNIRCCGTFYTHLFSVTLIKLNYPIYSLDEAIIIF